MSCDRQIGRPTDRPALNIMCIFSIQILLYLCIFIRFIDLCQPCCATFSGWISQDQRKAEHVSFIFYNEQNKIRRGVEAIEVEHP